jgi:nucleoside-diphosphate-sugar epimerase
LSNGYDVYATHRTSSSFAKCKDFKDKINWINADFIDWKNKIKEINPDQLIHVSWDGLDEENRNNWEKQIGNFWLSREYFDLAKENGIKKVIALGSQAEYGAYAHQVDETALPIPNDAYGAIKTLTANYLRILFENSGTAWYWIRVYSVFGEGENDNWLIPSVIHKLINHEPIHLTSCEQHYNYLYIEDFVNQLLAIVTCKENKSGIYNLCNSESISLKELLIRIADTMKVSTDFLKFGMLSLRPGQNMFISGDPKKFLASFDISEYKFTGLDKGLQNTVDHYKKYYESL